MSLDREVLRARAPLLRALVLAASVPAIVNGCAAATPSIHGEVTVASATSASSAAPFASASTSATSADAPPTEGLGEADCDEAAVTRALAKIEAARASKDKVALAAALDAALVVRFTDPKVRFEAMKLAQERGDAGAALEHAEALVNMDGDDALACHLLGLAAEARGEAEDARSLFARSARLDSFGPGAKKLGSRSHCTAAAHVPSRAAGTGLTIVRGWMGVFAELDGRRMVREELAPPRSEAQAKERACIHNDISSILARDVCTGPGPWDVQTGHMHFHDHRAIILPLAGQRFAVIFYFTGDGCRGGSTLSAKVVGRAIQLSGESRGMLRDMTGVCEDGNHDALTGPCIPTQEEGVSFYDARTGAHLLSFDERKMQESYEVKGTKVRRLGPGCDETLDLAALPKGLTPAPQHDLEARAFSGHHGRPGNASTT